MNWLHFSFGASLTTLLLAVGHWFPWPRRLSRLQAYVYGVSAIGLGFTIWRGLDGDWWHVAGLWVLAGLGGAVVFLAYWLDDIVIRLRKAEKGDTLINGTEKRRLED